MERVLIKLIDTMVPDYREVFGIKDDEIINAFNEFISSMPPPVPGLFPLLLRFLNLYPLFFRFRRLEDLDRQHRERILEKWAYSKLYVKRAIFSTLKTFFLLVFYSNENVEKKLGFERKCLLS